MSSSSLSARHEDTSQSIHRRTQRLSTAPHIPLPKRRSPESCNGFRSTWLPCTLARENGNQYMASEKAITIPNDWSFQPSSDGVGVLAPSALFGSGDFITIDPYGPVEPFVEAAADAMRNGHVATALRYLREGYWFNSTSQPIPLCDLLCEVYDKLNRPSFANVIRSRIDKWRKDARHLAVWRWFTVQ